MGAISARMKTQEFPALLDHYSALIGEWFPRRHEPGLNQFIPDAIRGYTAYLREQRRAGCNCHLPVNGPVPNFCPVHDGDYSSFLVMNNCD